MSHTAVRNAIKDGRLVKSVVYEGGKPKIIQELVRAEWKANSDHRKMAEKNSPVLDEPELELTGEAPKRIISKEPAPHSLPWQMEQARLAELPDEPDDKPLPADERPLSELNRLKRQKDFYAAETAKMDFETKAGRLVSAGVVQKQAFKLGRTVRDNILNLPDRLAPQLAAETDPHKCYALLAAELTGALKALIETLPVEHAV